MGLQRVGDEYIMVTVLNLYLYITPTNYYQLIMFASHFPATPLMIYRMGLAHPYSDLYLNTDEGI